METFGNLAHEAVGIVEVLRAAGYEAYFAGGCVRDLLLKRTPADIDIATSATPEQITELFPQVIPIGLKYGVVRVVAGRCSFEVATFRRDLEYSDGRHPQGIEFSGPEQDARRRDFTINGIFYDPLARRIVDFVSGESDLQRRIIRTIGPPEERFQEDKLRLLRALRLAATLDFKIHRDTLSSIGRMASLILGVSWERIRDELLKMFTSRGSGRALDLLMTSGLLEYVLPEVWATRQIEQPPEFHPEGDVFVHTRMMLQMLQHPTQTLALGVLFHDVGKPITFRRRERIRFDLHVDAGCVLAADACLRLRLSGEQTERVVALVRHHLRFMHVRDMRLSTRTRFLRMAHFDEHLELHRLDCLASHGDISNWEFCRIQLDALSREPASPPPLLTGHDLIALGFRPGPLFATILRSIEDAQLERQISSREEAIQLVIDRYGPET